MRILFQKNRGARVTNQNLHPNSDKLKERLNKNVSYLPIETTKNYSRCQIQYWVTKKNLRTNIVCSTCDVTLCINCYPQFHTVPYLVGSKRALAMQYCADVENDGGVEFIKVLVGFGVPGSRPLV